MRYPKTGSDLDDKLLTSDIAIPVCYHYDYLDEIDEDVPMMHIINCWLYGATNDEFDEYKPVHSEFIDAAKAYILKKGKDFLLKSKEKENENEK